MKTYTCNNCKEQKLWVDSNGFCIQCEEEFCPTCGSLLGNRICLTCEVENYMNVRKFLEERSDGQ